MTTWTIVTAGGTVEVAADEITTRQDGSLWALAALDPKPAPMRVVLILARGHWRAAHPSDVSPLPDPEPPPPKPARLLPAVDADEIANRPW
jgi:hypothetical protein